MGYVKPENLPEPVKITIIVENSTHKRTIEVDEARYPYFDTEYDEPDFFDPSGRSMILEKRYIKNVTFNFRPMPDEDTGIWLREAIEEKTNNDGH